MKQITLRPIGHVVSSRKTPEDENWAAEPCYIQLDKNVFSSESFSGLEDFSHVIVVFHFDQIPDDQIQTQARHPRDNPQWPKVGIFAQRAAVRPNRIGVTVCKIRKVDGTRLELEALDALDGTPVLDIKPCIREFGPQGEIVQPPWITDLMQKYWNE